MGIMWENTTPSAEYPLTFVPGSARCSSALCLFSLYSKIIMALSKHEALS